MSSKHLIRRSIAAIASSAALAAAIGPASALTSVAPSLPQSSAPIEKVWCGWGGCGWGGWGGGWGGWGGGWGPAAVVGGVIAGTAIGAAAAGAFASPYYYAPAPYYGAPYYYAPTYYGPAYYSGYYGAPQPSYYGSCWRRRVGYYGRVHWRRVC